jgi:hypothetical protein
MNDLKKVKAQKKILKRINEEDKKKKSFNTGGSMYTSQIRSSMIKSVDAKMKTSIITGGAKVNSSSSEMSSSKPEEEYNINDSTVSYKRILQELMKQSLAEIGEENNESKQKEEQTSSSYVSSSNASSGSVLDDDDEDEQNMTQKRRDFTRRSSQMMYRKDIEEKLPEIVENPIKRRYSKLLMDDDFNLEDAISNHKRIFEEVLEPKKIIVPMDPDNVINE